MLYGVRRDLKKQEKTIVVRKKVKKDQKKTWQDMLLEYRERLAAKNT